MLRRQPLLLKISGALGEVSRPPRFLFFTGKGGVARHRSSPAPAYSSASVKR